LPESGAAWIETLEETRRVEDKLNTVVVEALTDAGIEMPYPQVDVNLKGGPLHAGDSEVIWPVSTEERR
jgi:small-conductance mechanosensitive channel